MTSRNRSDSLLREIAQLFVKYTAAEWRSLIEELERGSDIQVRIADEIRTLTIQAAEAKAKRPRGALKRSTGKKTGTRVRASKAAKPTQVRAAHSFSPERSEILLALEQLLAERGALRSPADLREAFLKSGGKGELPKGRALAVQALLQHLDTVPPAAFASAIDALRDVGTAASSGDAYARWFNLIRPPGTTKDPGTLPLRERDTSEQPSSGSLPASSSSAIQSINSRTLPELNLQARELLTQAAQDSAGVLMRIVLLGGRYIQTNGKKFGQSGDVREFARYEYGLEQLQKAGLVSAAGTKGEVFRVTEPGYKVADYLRGSSTSET